MFICSPRQSNKVIRELVSKSSVNDNYFIGGFLLGIYLFSIYIKSLIGENPLKTNKKRVLFSKFRVVLQLPKIIY